jgi:hypothetical protein
MRRLVSRGMVGLMRSNNSHQLSTSAASPAGQRKSLELGSPLLAPQLRFPAFAFIHGQSLQLIHDPRAHLYRWRCHSNCRRSRFSGLGNQVCRKLPSRISRSRSRASSRSVFRCLTRVDHGWSPIHTSNPDSASSRSNQREYPLASIPTLTRIPRCFRSR